MITLVIIGVVAALTIPNLMQKYTEQTTVKKVQKFYSTLSNAYALAAKDNGSVDNWNLLEQTSEHAETIYELLFKPYFKIAKNCGSSNTGDCIDLNYRRLNNEDFGKFNHTSYYKIVLADGSAVIWRAGVGQSAAIYFDTNGYKEPNQWGKDLFLFELVQEKIYPNGAPKHSGQDYFSTHCKLTSDGYGCTAWIIFKGNMDYLHCDDLSWTGKDKCK